MLAMAIGAVLWGTSNVASERGRTVTKTRHIGVRYGYENLKWNPKSPMFQKAGGSGLTVRSYEDVICVNQWGLRFWNEMDDTYGFLNACLSRHENAGKNGKTNGGGPIWAIFDADAVKRESWKPTPPHIDPDGYFYSAATIPELAAKIQNPYQRHQISGAALQETVNRYNSFVASGVDADFKKPTPQHTIEKPPFYAAWATPILHDALTGLRTNVKAEVIDIRGEVIPGLYCAGESQGGFAQHGLTRCMVFGRIAGRHAAQRND
jgi:hypothetical protein